VKSGSARINHNEQPQSPIANKRIRWHE